MIRALIFMLLFGGAALGLIWATQTYTSQIRIPLGPRTELEINVVFAFVGMLILGGLIAILWNFLGQIYNLPTRLSRGLRVKAEKRAEQALTEGLLAAEAGETGAAMRASKKALDGESDPRLQTLLAARAAEAAKHWNEAELHWSRLAEMPGGQLAGLRGAAQAAAERGDDLAAEERTRSALYLCSDASWPFHSLFEFQVSRAKWDGALETLAVGKKRQLLDEVQAQRRRAVLLTAQASQFLELGQDKDAQTYLGEAIKAAPEFTPAIYLAARQARMQKRDKVARSILEAGWRTRPHPALAREWRALDMADISMATGRVNRLSAVNPDHVQSLILDAELALEREDWDAAIAVLEPTAQHEPTARLCLLLGRAYKGLNRTEKAESWNRLARAAPVDPDWSDLSPDGQAFDYDMTDWARLVFVFGDNGAFIHVRHEAFAPSLDVMTPFKRIEAHAPTDPEQIQTNEGTSTASVKAPKTWEAI